MTPHPENVFDKPLSHLSDISLEKAEKIPPPDIVGELTPYLKG